MAVFGSFSLLSRTLFNDELLNFTANAPEKFPDVSRHSGRCFAKEFPKQTLDTESVVSKFKALFNIKGFYFILASLGYNPLQ